RARSLGVGHGPETADAPTQPALQATTSAYGGRGEEGPKPDRARERGARVRPCAGRSRPRRATDRRRTAPNPAGSGGAVKEADADEQAISYSRLLDEDVVPPFEGQGSLEGMTRPLPASPALDE